MVGVAGCVVALAFGVSKHGTGAAGGRGQVSTAEDSVRNHDFMLKNVGLPIEE